MAKKVITLEEILAPHVRPVTQEDFKNLPVYSYSKIDLFEGCPYKYLLKYVQKNYEKNVKAIHLDVGNIYHKVLELKARMLINGNTVDYDYLKEVLEEGIEEVTDKGSEKIIGLKDIRKKFLGEYYQKDDKTGMSYADKEKIFLEKVLPKELEDEGWKPYDAEMTFDFVYIYEDENGNEKEAIIHGFIDSVQVNDDGNFRVVDYKSSKKSYDPKKLATPLQQCIYGMALYTKFGKLPIEYRYDFILIDEYQKACTVGYLKRAIKKLDKIFNKIDALEVSKEYVPKATPLCYYCSYCANNPNAEIALKNLCQYYSLWTPKNKSFSVNKEYTGIETEQVKPKSSGRKLFF